MYHQFTTKAWEIVAYTFQADIWCLDCISDYGENKVNSLLETRLWGAASTSTEELLSKWADVVGIDRNDESSYDSGDFPKVVFASSMEDIESCGQCGEEI